MDWTANLPWSILQRTGPLVYGWAHTKPKRPGFRTASYYLHATHTPMPATLPWNPMGELLRHFRDLFRVLGPLLWIWLEFGAPFDIHQSSTKRFSGSGIDCLSAISMPLSIEAFGSLRRGMKLLAIFPLSPTESLVYVHHHKPLCPIYLIYSLVMAFPMHLHLESHARPV